jgi:predicted RNA-binding protein YlxR (DUF448 family)
MGCGATDPQHSLLRITRDRGTGALTVDAERRGAGRGGYLHPRPDCWVRFARRKGPLRSLRVSVDRPARAALVDQLAVRVVR